MYAIIEYRYVQCDYLKAPMGEYITESIIVDIEDDTTISELQRGAKNLIKNKMKGEWYEFLRIIKIEIKE